jgi:hypothetical protein
LRVAVAYDIPHGDPIKNWSPLDFTISNSKRVGCLSPQGRGATVRRVQGNIVLVDCDPEREDFTFSLSGFDRHRDVFLRIDDISGENSGEPEE